MKSKNRIIRNSIVLMAKMFVSVCFAFFSTRLLLQALGVDDFGVYNVIAGAISLFSVMNITMAFSMQRYLSVKIGRKENDALRRVFSSGVLLYFSLGLAIFVVLELSALFLFKNVLNIPPDRVQAAKYIYHAMTIACFFTIASVPYEAAITAFEKMGVLAVMGIVESASKLGIAMMLIWQPFDRLIVYGFLIALLTVVILGVKRIYCRIYIKEIFGGFNIIRRQELKEMFSFTIWTTLTTFCDIGQTHGMAIILNVFHGARANAAYGVALLVSGQAKYLMAVLFKAASPQVISRVAGGSLQDAIRLVFSASKISFLFVLALIIPLWIEMDFLLKFWLGDPPQYSAWFCRIILMVPLIKSLTYSFQNLIHAVGLIGSYQRALAFVQIFVLPVAYILLYLRVNIYFSLLVIVIAEIGLSCIRIFFARRLCCVSIREFVAKIMAPAIVIFLLSLFISAGVPYVIKSPFGRLLTITFCSSSVIGLSAWAIMFEPREKIIVRDLLWKLNNIFFVRLLSICGWSDRE